MIFGERVKERCCRVEQRKKKRKSKGRWARSVFWCSKKIREFDFGGGVRGMLGKKISHPLFNFFFSLHSHLFFLCIRTFLQRIISLYTHTHTHTYIYIYPYLYKVISITLKEHICSIISQYQSFMHLKVIKIMTCI